VLPVTSLTGFAILTALHWRATTIRKCRRTAPGPTS
jgi:hypothetical protein